MQLAAALRAAHGARRALRAQALAPSKVLLTSPGRIRVGARAAGSTALRHALCWSFLQDCAARHLEALCGASTKAAHMLGKSMPLQSLCGL